jgi:hypothetical protein
LNISQPFIRRPIATTMLMIGITLLGAVAYQQLPVASLPSGINNAISRIAGMLAVALLGAFAVWTFRFALDARLTELQVASEIRLPLTEEVPKLAEAQVPLQVQGQQRLVLKRAPEESFVRSFRLVMLVSACVALTSALCAWLTTARLAGQKTRPR